MTLARIWPWQNYLSNISSMIEQLPHYFRRWEVFQKALSASSYYTLCFHKWRKRSIGNIIAFSFWPFCLGSCVVCTTWVSEQFTNVNSFNFPGKHNYCRKRENIENWGTKKLKVRSLKAFRNLENKLGRTEMFQSQKMAGWQPLKFSPFKFWVLGGFFVTTHDKEMHHLVCAEYLAYPFCPRFMTNI